MEPIHKGMVQTEPQVRLCSDCPLQFPDQVSLRSERHGIPIEGDISGPHVISFMVFGCQHHVSERYEKNVLQFLIGL